LDTFTVEKALHLKSEKIQIYLRIFIVLSVVTTFYLINPKYLEIKLGSFVSTLDFFIFVVSSNILYHLYLFKYPYQYQVARIMLVSIFDITATVYVMYLVGPISAYYTVLLLWYIIGYGLRFGRQVAYLAHVSVVITWVVLIHTSAFWIANQAFAYSWLITFILLPIYYFKLVHTLKAHLLSLQKDIKIQLFRATHDSLTKLPNRASFEEKILDLTKNNKIFALFFIDLDGFKAINDKYGHDIGDKVLIEFTQKLKKTNMYTARLGGDEFVSILECENKGRIREEASYVMRVINSKFSYNDIYFSSSIGIAIFPDDAQDAYNLKKKSDQAMYEAKLRGKNTFVFFDEID